VLAEFVGQGVAPLATRADLQTSIEPQPTATRVGAIIDRIEAGTKGIGTSGLSAGVVADSWARVLDPRPDASPPSQQDAAVALVSLRQVENRDGIVALLMPSTLAPDRLPAEGRELIKSIRRRIALPLTDPTCQCGVQQRLTALCQLTPKQWPSVWFEVSGIKPTCLDRYHTPRPM
jgi:hypothetical protein